jgi:3-methylcrotonyl-CoA carboxylase alpha subunit
VPVVPGYFGDDQSPAHLQREADTIGYPVLIKAVAGGGGKGMRRVDAAGDFAKALEGAQREAQSAFGDARVLIEKYVQSPRHIEIQVFADGHGNAVHLFERDCSLQRRHQKVIEEAPAPGMSDALRKTMGDAAVTCAKAIGYRGAGTVEFIVDGSKGLSTDGFYFMEMNTRLQVEHPVTEMITGHDLVEWQLRVASGERLPVRQQDLSITGHAVEVRLYAEDPAKQFLPSIGRLSKLNLPSPTDHVRVDAGVAEGGEVTMFYDPMIAKVIAWNHTRVEALGSLADALETSEVAGVRTNQGFLISTLRHPAMIEAKIDTGFIDRHRAELIAVPPAIAEDALTLVVTDLLLARREASDGRTPFGKLDGWRLGGLAQTETMKIKQAGEPRDVLIGCGRDGWTLTVGGQSSSVTARRLASGGVEAVRAGRRITGSVVTSGAQRFVMVKGRTFAFELVDPLAASDQGHLAANELRAPMPGKIIQMHAKPGDRVKRGQALAVMEAMKMEHTLTAPADAVVKSVGFKAGDQVPEAAVVIAFEA